MGVKITLSKADIAALKLLELLFDADSGNTGDYSKSESQAVQRLFKKIHASTEGEEQ